MDPSSNLNVNKRVETQFLSQTSQQALDKKKFLGRLWSSLTDKCRGAKKKQRNIDRANELRKGWETTLKEFKEVHNFGKSDDLLKKDVEDILMLRAVNIVKFGTKKFEELTGLNLRQAMRNAHLIKEGISSQSDTKEVVPPPPKDMPPPPPPKDVPPPPPQKDMPPPLPSTTLKIENEIPIHQWVKAEVLNESNQRISSNVNIIALPRLQKTLSEPPVDEPTPPAGSPQTVQRSLPTPPQKPTRFSTSETTSSRVEDAAEPGSEVSPQPKNKTPSDFQRDVISNHTRAYGADDFLNKYDPEDGQLFLDALNVAFNFQKEKISEVEVKALSVLTDLAEELHKIIVDSNTSEKLSNIQLLDNKFQELQKMSAKAEESLKQLDQSPLSQSIGIAIESNLERVLKEIDPKYQLETKAKIIEDRDYKKLQSLCDALKEIKKDTRLKLFFDPVTVSFSTDKKAVGVGVAKKETTKRAIREMVKLLDKLYDSDNFPEQLQKWDNNTKSQKQNFIKKGFTEKDYNEINKKVEEQRSLIKSAISTAASSSWIKRALKSADLSLPSLVIPKEDGVKIDSQKEIRNIKELKGIKKLDKNKLEKGGLISKTLKANSLEEGIKETDIKNLLANDVFSERGKNCLIKFANEARSGAEFANLDNVKKTLGSQLTRTLKESGKSISDFDYIIESIFGKKDSNEEKAECLAMLLLYQGSQNLGNTPFLLTAALENQPKFSKDQISSVVDFNNLTVRTEIPILELVNRSGKKTKLKDCQCIVTYSLLEQAARNQGEATITFQSTNSKASRLLQKALENISGKR